MGSTKSFMFTIRSPYIPYMSRHSDRRSAPPKRPNVQLSALIAEAGLSNIALAREVGATALRHGLQVSCDHNHVRRWRLGHASRAVPPQFIAEALADQLGRCLSLADIGMGASGLHASAQGLLDLGTTPDAIRAGLVDLCRDDLDPRGGAQPPSPPSAFAAAVLTWRVPGAPRAPASPLPGRRVTPGDVDRIRAAAAAFDTVERGSGGPSARLPAVQYLRATVAPLLGAGYDGAIGRELFAAAALCTHGAARYSFDAGLPGSAGRYAILALGMAHQGDDRLLGAHVVATLAEQTLLAGSPDLALTYIRTALDATAACGDGPRAALRAVEARLHERLPDGQHARQRARTGGVAASR